MSAATPGAQPARKILAEPLGPLFLAGEATHETLWGTVDGAWDSGERAADAALRRIGAIRDSEPIEAPERPRRRRRGSVRSVDPDD
jgi:flavin-dependent amine oxidoreductase